ncbi:DUF3479 domain-containing protein [Leptolyngbya sp. 15MV]|nr:DUF3479 domain-containing protein [Leptolyngbya sp. 15MV]
MPKPISRAEAIRVVVVTMDSHLAGAMVQAHQDLRVEMPGLHLAVHAADEWAGDAAALAACHEDIARADILIVAMLFLEDHIAAVLPALAARRPHCDAMVCMLSAGEVMKLTRAGRFDMGVEASGIMGLLKKLRGAKKQGGGSSGKGQMRMLRELPRLLRFIPGTAQDVRAYFLALQYWLAGSRENLANLVRLLVNRYAAGPRAALTGSLKVAAPVQYPEIGLYHPRAPGRVTENPGQLPREGRGGTVGLLIMRSYVLAGNAAHYDGVIAALESRGLNVIPAFAHGLDNRPAIERFFMKDGAAAVDAVVSLTGFSLVGGPAYNDAHAAEALLARLDVPYVSAHPLEFQTIRQWEADPRGLLPVEATMIAHPRHPPPPRGPHHLAQRPRLHPQRPPPHPPKPPPLRQVHSSRFHPPLQGSVLGRAPPAASGQADPRGTPAGCRTQTDVCRQVGLRCSSAESPSPAELGSWAHHHLRLSGVRSADRARTGTR